MKIVNSFISKIFALNPLQGISRETEIKVYQIALKAIPVIAAALAWNYRSSLPPFILAPIASAMIFPYEYLKRCYEVRHTQLQCLNLVESDPKSYKLAPEMNAQYILDAIRANHKVFDELSDEQKNLEFGSKQNNVETDEEQTINEFTKKAISVNPMVFHLLEDVHYRTEWADIVTMSLFGCAAVEVNLKDHLQQLKKLLDDMPEMFYHFSPEVRSHKDLAEIAIEGNPDMLLEVFGELRTDSSLGTLYLRTVNG